MLNSQGNDSNQQQRGDQVTRLNLIESFQDDPCRRSKKDEKSQVIACAECIPFVNKAEQQES